MRERIRQRQNEETRSRRGAIALWLLLTLATTSTHSCHAFLPSTTTRRRRVSPSSATAHSSRSATVSLFARSNSNSNKRRPAQGQNHNPNHSGDKQNSIRKNNVVVSSIRTNYKQVVWEQPTKGHNVNRQFQSRFARYEEEKLHGRVQNDSSTAAIKKLKKTTNNKKASQQQIDLSEKIRILLSDDDDDDSSSSSSSSSLFLDSQTIADHDTVFRKLSDEDKNQATFAVSKDEQTSNDDESLLEANNKKRSKIRANVLETGQESMHHYYMKSMGQHQVLSMQDEQVLGRQIQLFNKWEETRQELEEELLRAPTFQEWADSINTTVPLLKKQIRRSQQAKAALVEANLRLVVTVARQTVRQGRTEINFQDACQEGILGLTRASEKFDPEKGFRFSSYAVWWIKKRIHQSVTEQSRPMRLPPSVIRKINDIRIHEKILQDELGRKPSDDEVASKVAMTVEQLEFYRKSANQVISLDKQVRFNKQSDNPSNIPTMHSMVKDPDSSPTELAQKQMLKDDVQRLILTLKPREQAVIRMRFGLDNGTPRTLQEIADKFLVDKEVVRTIEARALRKMRQPYRNQSLKSYITDL